MLNVVVLIGVLARPAQDVELPSGSRLLALEVTVRREEGPAETVPVSWFDAPAWATALDSGADVVVVGRVRRRFFRSGGSTQSRTEVVASKIARGSAASRVRALLSEASSTIQSAQAASGASSAPAEPVST